MAKPKITPQGYLGSTITDPAILREVSTLIEAVATIAADNKTPFFPAYTDHGVDHLQAVLDWCVRLTPTGALSLLDESNVAVVIGGALLHDVAMHLHVPGFIELVSGRWPAPLPWFDEPQGRRPPDRPWDQLWDDFRSEARHFDHTEIERLLGPTREGAAEVVYEDEIRRERLTEPDRLYIGEFLRRHHARLAHEIAVHGFPGLGAGFPAPEPGLAKTLRELMGLVARSHNEDLRLVVDHMRGHRGSLQASGVYVPFAAALLRIADFAQLDFRRAPSLLLRMAAPQSRISIDEWAKHEAVEMVVEDGDDPDAIRIEVSADDIGLSTYLQLEELFDGLQRELETCSAVLAEVYGSNRHLAALRLTKRRLRHNLATPKFRADLPFVPREARLRSAEDMFRLVIHDLYGDHPWVAGRELAQNALDAVRERWRVEMPGAVRPADDGWPDRKDPSVDVLVEVTVGDDDRLLLRIADRGIGMTADTVIDYFLRAGASLGPTRREVAEIPDGDAARYVKAGRFGIGALAAFLLGHEVEVRTRHLTEETGLAFTARLDSELIEIARGTDMPVGTEVRIHASDLAVELLAASDPSSESIGTPWQRAEAATQLAEGIRRSWGVEAPRVKVTLDALPPSSPFPIPPPEWEINIDAPSVPATTPPWQEVDVAGISSMAWASDDSDPQVILNGIRVIDPEDTEQRFPPYRWSDFGVSKTLQEVGVTVGDPSHGVALTLNRFHLRPGIAPFEQELLRSITCEIVAGSLVRGSPPRHLWKEPWCGRILTSTGWYPFLAELGAVAPLGPVHLMVVVASDHHDGWTPAAWQLPPDEIPVARAVWSLQPADFGASWFFQHHVSSERTLDSIVREVENHLDMLGHGLDEIRCSAQDERLLTHLAQSVRLQSVLVDRIDEGAGADPFVVAASSSPEAVGALVFVGSPTSPRRSLRRVSRPASTLLGETWMAMVGGPVPYDDGEREALAERVHEEHPEMRPHIDRQRRVLAEEAAG